MTTTQPLRPRMEKRKQQLFHNTLSIYGSSYHCCQNTECKTITHYAGGFHGLRAQTEHAACLQFVMWGILAGRTPRLGWLHCWGLESLESFLPHVWGLRLAGTSASFAAKIHIPGFSIRLSMRTSLDFLVWTWWPRSKRASQTSKRAAYDISVIQPWASRSVTRGMLYWSKRPPRSTQLPEEGKEPQTTGWEVCQDHIVSASGIGGIAFGIVGTIICNNSRYISLYLTVNT